MAIIDMSGPTGSPSTPSTITTLIARSVSHNEIVHTEWTSELETEILAACEDSTRNDDVLEAWGTTDEGSEWRVHLDGAPDDSGKLRIFVATKRYEDEDDCLAAAARDVAAERGIETWQVSADWQDNERDVIEITVTFATGGAS